MTSLPVIHTVGHSTRSAEEFLALLRANGIAAIADVRRFPASRRHPHFARDAMAAWLADAGIGYRHVEALGGRRAARPDSINTGLRHPSFRGYADYMQTTPFRDALDAVVAWAAGQPTALLCAEAVWWQCHRGLIADVLTARGHEVRHILDSRAAPRVHRLHEVARIADGEVRYPGLL